MINNIFKVSFLLALFCIIGLLFGIYQKMGNGRFQISDGSVLDSKNGKIYLYNQQIGGYYKLNKKHIQQVPEVDVLGLEELPQ